MKSNSLYKFCHVNKLDDIASKFLKVPKSSLSTRPSFRIDVPQDTRNTYDWHQDSVYDNFNISSDNGVTLWIPLINTTKKNGTVLVKPGSQNEKGKIRYSKHKGSKYKSEQIVIHKKFLKKYKSKSVNVKAYNALAFHHGVFHKSGYNSSKQVRFVVLARYNKMISKDFIHFRDLK